MATLTTASTPSHYEALSSPRKEIRVLDVAPASGDDIIDCTMRRISLIDNPVPVYETISYCWGLPRAPSTIKLNRRLTPVPASSEVALKRMRLSDRPRVLWIDAICIDQSSVTERSAQVALMATVYRVARQNLIYLGEDDGMAERGVKAVQSLVNDMRAATADFTLLFQTIFDVATGVPFYSNENFSEEVDFEALEALFSLHWFRRLWVLQEAVLAQSNTCHWGTSNIELLDTVRAARWLAYKFRFISQDLYDCAGWRCAAEMFDFLNPDNRTASKRRSLAVMLEIAQLFEKTEPKDSIYAILGLLDHEVPPDNSQLALLGVDYSKSLADVLRDATRYALSQKRNLKALHKIDHRFDALADSQMLPTWSIRPDLKRQAQSSNLLPTFFSACNGLEAPSLLGDVSFGENVLLLQGLEFDEVVQTTIIASLQNALEECERYYEWLISAKNMAVKYCNTTREDTLLLAMAFTLVAGETDGRKRARAHDLQFLLGYLKDLNVHEESDSPDEATIKMRFDRERTISLFETCRVVFCMGRRFFVTAAGGMGIGPRCMQPGDSVVVVRGSSKPFILRKKGDHYWLVGEAYVHGVMDGLAVYIQKSRGISEEVFQVR